MSEKFDKDGLINIKECKITGKGDKKQVKKPNKWKPSYFNLIGGSFHIYKDVEASSPTRTVQLKTSQLNKRLTDKEYDGTFVFSLTTEEIELLVQLEDEETWKQIIEAVDENMKKAARPPLNKDKKSGRLAALRDKTKKNVIDKAATSPMGKKAIRAKAPKEITNLIDAIKQIAKRESNSQKKAEEVEQNLFKIGVKCYILVNQKKDYSCRSVSS